MKGRYSITSVLSDMSRKRYLLISWLTLGTVLLWPGLWASRGLRQRRAVSGVSFVDALDAILRGRTRPP